jgi:surfactin synthase thioesterase subunit
VSPGLSPLVRLRGDTCCRARIIFFPWAGSGAYAYARWKSVVTEDLEIFAVQLPGREQRIKQTPYDCLADAVEEILPAVHSLGSKPLIFFGISMGALLAYQIALALEKLHSRSLETLCVAGRNPPQCLASENWHSLDDAELLQKVSGLGGTPASLLEDSNMRKLMLRNWRADLLLCETCRREPPVPLSCPIIAFWAEDDPMTSSVEVPKWAACTTNRFAPHVFAKGGHFFAESFSKEIMDAIRTCSLSRTSAEPATSA